MKREKYLKEPGKDLKVTGTTSRPTKQSQARGSGDLATQAESGTPAREGDDSRLIKRPLLKHTRMFTQIQSLLQLTNETIKLHPPPGTLLKPTLRQTQGPIANRSVKV